MPPALSDLTSLNLDEIVRLANDPQLPPVERWNPGHTGHSGMRIARDGTWYHDGDPILRAELVRLFSRVLRREPDGGFVLVTPGEKLDIDVEDAPFVAIEVASEGSGPSRTLAFRLNTGDPIVAGPDHAINVDDRQDGPHPTLQVRRGLLARIDRPVYYELADLALGEGADPPGLWSSGTFFRLDGQA